MKSIKSLLLLSLLFGMINLFSGCTAMIHDSALKESPALADVLGTAPDLPDNMARVVFYYPRDVAIGILGPGGFAVDKLKLEGDSGSIALDLLDQTGCYIDVPAGEYAYATKPSLSQNFEQGRCYYVKIGKAKPGVSLNSWGGIKPTLVDEETAEAELGEFKIKHACSDKALGFALVPKDFQKSKLTPTSADLKVATLKKQLTQAPAPSECARLFVINNLNFVGGAGKFEVGIDGTASSERFGRKKYICVDMAPGMHTLYTQVSAIGIKQAAPKFLLTLNLERCGCHYLAMDMEGTYFLSQEEGQKLTKKYKLIKGGYYTH